MDIANKTASWPFIDPLVSVRVMDVFLMVNDFVLCSFFSILGMITNTMNIIVYYKMGFSESSNVSFMALSVFDFLVSLVSFVPKLLFTPVLRGTATVIVYMVGKLIFVTVGGSSMMTALISIERCLCVVFPLKVKTFLSRDRVLYLVLTVAVYHVVFLILLYTDTGSVFDEYSEKEGFYYFSLYAVPSTLCFCIVVMATILLVVRLRKNLKWRRTTAVQSEKTSDKETKLASTIIAISTLFIICFLPNVINFIAQSIYPDYNYSNPYLGTLITVTFSFTGVFQAISSSVNIFFYYRMSSKLRAEFDKTFRKF